mmetsp:Transcript_47868/g.108628  ORF Transcript_47868/g.108628 Transcript_47868/m.108628 type:complete len:352 (-) Transcript_47868:262-1317(-)
MGKKHEESQNEEDFLLSETDLDDVEKQASEWTRAKPRGGARIDEHLAEFMPLTRGATLTASFSDDSPRQSELNLDSVVDEAILGLDRALKETQKHSTFKLFLAIYTVFLAPALWFFIQEAAFPPKLAPAVIPMAPSSVGLLGFMTTVLGLYAFLRLMCSTLSWKQRVKSPAQHKEDLLRIARLSAALGVIGRVANRVHAPDGLIFLGLIIYYTIFFAAIYEVAKNLNIKLTRDCVRNPYTIFVTGVTVVLVGGVLGLHCVFAAEDRDLVEFLGLLAMAALFHAALLVGPGNAHVHVHHWYWAFAAAHMCVFDSRTSQLAQAMFCGCYIHGVALFGVEKCFYIAPDFTEEYS